MTDEPNPPKRLHTPVLEHAREEKSRRLEAIEPWLEDGVLPSAPHRRCAESLIVSPATASRSKATTRSRPTFCRARSRRSTRQQVHDLHLLISSISRPEHLTLFERGIAQQARFRVRRPAEPARRAVARRRHARDRRDPYVRRAVCADVRRPDAATSRWCAPMQGRPARQSLYRRRTPKTRRPSSRPPRSATAS